MQAWNGQSNSAGVMVLNENGGNVVTAMISIFATNFALSQNVASEGSVTLQS